MVIAGNFWTITSNKQQKSTNHLPKGCSWQEPCFPMTRDFWVWWFPSFLLVFPQDSHPQWVRPQFFDPSLRSVRLVTKMRVSEKDDAQEVRKSHWDWICLMEGIRLTTWDAQNLVNIWDTYRRPRDQHEADPLICSWIVICFSKLLLK